MIRTTLCSLMLTIGIFDLAASDLQISVSRYHDSVEAEEPWTGPSSQFEVTTTEWSAPFELRGKVSPDVTAVKVSVALAEEGETASPYDTYQLKGFQVGNTEFSYILYDTLGNLREGRNVYTVTAVHQDGTSETKTFVLRNFDPGFFDEKGPPPVPAASGQAITWARLGPSDQWQTGPFPGLNDPSTFRFGRGAFYVRLDGSVLQAARGQTPWIHVAGFSEGKAWVLQGTREGGVWAVIDQTGKVLYQVPYRQVWRFVSGFALVQGASGFWGVINDRGGLVIPTEYEIAEYPSPLMAKTVTFSPKKGPRQYVDLPSGRDLGVPPQAQYHVIQESGGGVYRVMILVADNGNSSRIQTFRQDGALLGSFEASGTVSFVTWLPQADAFILQTRIGDTQESFAVSVTGVRLGEFPRGTSVLEGSSGQYLLRFGELVMSYDLATQSLGRSFHGQADWIDPTRYRTKDARGRDQLTDVVRGVTVPGPAKPAGLWIVGDTASLVAAAETPAWAGNHGPGPWSNADYATSVLVNDSKVRLRSEPSLKGKVLAVLDADTILQADDFGNDTLTVDGVLGFWIHIQPDPDAKRPGGWIFSRFLTYYPTS